MNRPTIQTCKFQNISKGQEVGVPTFGFRMYDDYNQTYCNNWDSIPKNDFDILELVIESEDAKVNSMFDYMEENEVGVNINGTYYKWEEVKGLL
jgi:hypothetical protein